LEIQRRRAEGVGWDEIAILYRNNFMSRGYEEALMRARIPYVIVGDVGFYQRAEIKDALAILRLAATPDDRQSDAFPSDYSDRDEERRLAYVALTRGMRRITISYCCFRRGPVLPSPFLD